MWCMKCDHDLFECTCLDIKERLAALGRSPYLVMTHCSGCGEHISQCHCPDKPDPELRAQGRIIADRASVEDELARSEE